MQYVDMNSVIAEAISITPDTDAGDWAIARQWVVTALMQLGTSEDEIQICIIKAINLTLPKPDNLRCYVEMALYDSQKNYIPHIFRGGNRRIYPDNRVTTPLGTTGTVTASQVLHTVPVDVSEDQLNFYLGTNGREVDTAWVRYFAYPMDNNGLPMIREDEKFAIMTYIQWASASKRNENQSEIAMKWQMWAKQHDMARARKKSDMSNDMHKTIARFWMKLIPEFNSSRF